MFLFLSLFLHLTASLRHCVYTWCLTGAMMSPSTSHTQVLSPYLYVASCILGINDE